MRRYMDMKTLADEIIRGRRLTKEDDLGALVEADLKELCEGADKIRKALCGDRADLCSIINGRSGGAVRTVSSVPSLHITIQTVKSMDF